MKLFLDLETYSELDLKVVGLDRYSAHASARILMCAYAVDNGPVQLWQVGEDPEPLKELIRNSVCVPWNASFERAMLARVWNVRPKDWLDAMVLARYASLPSHLKDCNRVPYFLSQAETSKETLLINKFCKPGKSPHNRETDPEDWERFCQYCKADVHDTRMIYSWVIEHFDVPERVLQVWKLDQEINKRGMPVDLPFVYNAKIEADRLQAIALHDLKELTGLENPNSPAQLLKWVNDRGYVYNSLGKELVKKAVGELPDGECKAALQLRLAGAKSSVKKLGKILATIGAGSRLRDQYAFYKAHTGRWAGKGAQLQNLKAPRTKEEKVKVAEVVAALEAGREVASLDDLSLSLRPAICAPRGKKVVLGDFKSVENRGLAWISGCESMMEVYRKGLDPYIDFASRMEGIPYELVTAEMRQVAKPGTLGCGFGLGGGQEVWQARCRTCKQVWAVKIDADTAQCPICKQQVQSDQVQKTGLWRYAEMMGVPLTQNQAQKQVDEFRQAFSDVCNFWLGLEDCFAKCVKTRRSQYIISSLGPTLWLNYRDPALRIVLPSGRELVYASPYVQEGRNEWGYKTLKLGFDGVCGNSWGRHQTYGGRLCENVVQAIAADLLMDALMRVSQDTALEIVGHTHDEIITLADEADATAVQRLESYMTATEPWAAGLLMAADCHEGRRYGK